jgi:hypothetical protein
VGHCERLGEGQDRRERVMTKETTVLHDLYHQHPRIKSALKELDSAKAASEDLLVRSAAAVEKHEREKREALDRGEVFAPVLGPIPSKEVRERAARQVDAAEASLDKVMAEIAVELSQQLEQREAEILEQATSTNVGDLGPLLDEVNSLLATKHLLAKALRRDWESRPSPGPIKAKPPVQAPTPQMSAADFVEAALSGESLLGVTELPVERKSIAFFSPEGEAVLRHGFANEGRSA